MRFWGQGRRENGDERMRDGYDDQGATSMRGDGETVANGGERGLSRSPVWGGREPDRAEPSLEMNRPPQGALGV